MSTNTKAVRPGKLAGWLTLARVSNSPTVVSNVVAGAALAGATQAGTVVGSVAVAMVLFYTAGMFLNDVCDEAWDRINRPDRPIVSGAIPRVAAIAGTVALFAAGLTLLAGVSWGALLSGIVLVGLIAVYDRWHKNNPLSPLVMSSCRAMVYVTAFVAFAWPPTVELLAAIVLLVLYMAGLTAIAKSETRPSVTGYWPAALLFAPAVYYAPGSSSVATLALVVVFAGWALYSTTFVYRRVGRNIGAAVGHLIAGISLFDALVLESNGAGLGVVVAVAAFFLTLVFQRYVSGT